MGATISAKDPDYGGVNQGAPALNLAQLQNTGQSNPIDYTPETPEPPNIMERLERGFIRTVESTPQVIGQGLYYLGSYFNPHATTDEIQNGSNFADRMAQMGLTMTERNQKAMATQFPEKPDWAENIGGAGPMIGGIVMGTLAGAPLETGIGLALGAGAAANNSAFMNLRGQGDSMNKSIALAAAVGVTSTGTMALGVGNFLKAVGNPVVQFAKGIINGFTGGVLQSAATSGAEMVTGVRPHNPDDIKDAIAEAVGTGVTFAVWGGPLGVHQAFAQHAKVEQGIQQLGFSKQEARQMANKMMAQGMDLGIKKAEDLVKQNPDEARRMRLAKILKNKPIDDTGAPRTDALDEPFVPTEPTKTEALTADLEGKKRSFEILKTDIKALKEGVGELEDVQQKARDRIAAGLDTVSENVKAGKPLDTFEIAKLEQARQELASAEKDADKLRDQIDDLKERLKPKTNPIEELAQQIAKIKQGFRAGTSATLKDAEYVQKEFNRLVDQNDLSLADKAKFRKNVPLTVENFQKELPNILNKMQQLEQHAEQKKWIKDLKKLNIDKLPIEERDMMEEVLKGFDFGFPTRAKIMSRASTIAHFEKVLGGSDPSTIVYTYNSEGVVTSVKYNLQPGERQALEDASKLSIPEILREPNGHERLRNIVNAIKSAYLEGVMKGKYYSNLKIRDHATWKEKSLIKLASAKSRLSSFENGLGMKNRTWFKRILDSKDGAWMAQLHSDMIFHLLGWGDEMQILHEGYQNKIELGRQYDEQMEKIHPRDDVGDALKGSHDIEVKLGDETRTYKGVTGNQLLKTYAQSFEEGSIQHIENTFKRPGDSVDTARQIMREMLKQTAKLYPEQCKSVIKQFEYFRGPGFTELDKAVVAMTGHHMSKVDFYDPLSRLEDRSGMTQDDMQMGVKGMQGRAEVNPGITITRVKSELAIKNLDYYGDLKKNSIARANYISMAKIIHDMNVKAFDPQIVKAIRDSLGEDAVRVVHTLLRELAAGGSNHYFEMDRLMSELRTNFIIGKIGLNLFSVAKVPAQLSFAADYVGKMYVQKAIFKFAMNPGKLNEYVRNNSLMMKNMYLRQERDMENLISTGGASDMGPVKARDQIAKIAMFLHLQMDMFGRNVTWLGQEMKMNAEAPEATRNEINAACDAAVRWTHPMGGTLYLPAAFRGNEVQKALTTFHSATNRAFNLQVKNNRDLGEGKQNYWQYAKHLIGLGLVPAAIVAAAGLHRKPTARELALEYLNQTTGSEIYSGWVTNMLLSGRDVVPTAPIADLFTHAGHTAMDKSLRSKVGQGLSVVDDLLKTPLSNGFRDAMMVADMAQGKSIAEPHRGIGADADKEPPATFDDNPLHAGRL